MTENRDRIWAVEVKKSSVVDCWAVVPPLYNSKEQAVDAREDMDNARVRGYRVEA